jgi:hypothetical protein
MRLNNLREVANQSARQALTRHFWSQHRSSLLLKVALTGMSFALAGVLYRHQGVLDVSTSTVAWGAAAIGLITLSGLVHTWNEVSRLNARFRPGGESATDESTSDS